MNLYGLIGYPLSHSFSQRYFTEKFERENILHSEYRSFPLSSITQFPALLKAHPELRGMNVTIPYKEAILPYLDALDDTAAAIGAVNTIAFVDGRLIGYNTDAYGFSQSLKPFLKPAHERALILGTGGASRAVAYVLKQLGVQVFFASRKANGDNVMEYKTINEHVLNACKLVVNTTPLGMWPNVAECPDIPYEYITDQHLLYDLVYNPETTSFLAKGKQQGANTVNGLSMLHLQAEKAWEVWQ